MPNKPDLTEQMRWEAGTPNFDAVLSLLDSIPSLRSRQAHKSLSFYRQNQIVAALRTHTLVGTGTFVLSVPKSLARSCPAALDRARDIWASHPLDDQSNPGNKESAFPMIVTDQTMQAAQQIIDCVFRQFAETGCQGIVG